MQGLVLGLDQGKHLKGEGQIMMAQIIYGVTQKQLDILDGGHQRQHDVQDNGYQITVRLTSWNAAIK